MIGCFFLNYLLIHQGVLLDNFYIFLYFLTCAHFGGKRFHLLGCRCLEKISEDQTLTVETSNTVTMSNRPLFSFKGIPGFRSYIPFSDKKNRDYKPS